MAPTAEAEAVAGCHNPGPGPASYNIPTTAGYEGHDVSRHRNPRYSFGTKTFVTSKDVIPGPKYLLAKNLTRFGHNDSPKYTFGLKPKPLTTFVTPGPGTYTIVEKRRQGCTMASKPPPRKVTEIPGPNRYNVPVTFSRGSRHPTLREGPAYTITGYGGYCTQSPTPGPADYTLDSKNTAPKFSFGLKARPVTSKFVSPGPAAYYPTYNTMTNSPKFSFGLKRSDCGSPFILPVDVC